CPDESGNLGGRGVYICKHSICAERGLRPPALSRALRTPVTRDAANGLRETVVGLLSKFRGSE
ncbi:MAG: DUF448 domain-containing protein, partial [Thermodesulfobacteriota bacterium]